MKRVCHRLDDAEVERLDTYARTRAMTRSDAIRQLLAIVLDQYDAVLDDSEQDTKKAASES